MKDRKLMKLTFSSIFLSLGYILPFFTGQIPEIGNLLLPMHIPVMLTGVVSGAVWGLGVGLVLPITRSLIFSRPVLFPSAIAMSFELGVYGFTIGLIYHLSKNKNLLSLYKALLISMLSGRIVWGGVMYVFVRMIAKHFTLSAFFAGAFIEAWPGIILQIIVIPLLIAALGRAHVVEFTTPSLKSSNKKNLKQP